jgi:hypothetical protein
MKVLVGNRSTVFLSRGKDYNITDVFWNLEIGCEASSPLPPEANSDFQRLVLQKGEAVSMLNQAPRHEDVQGGGGGGGGLVVYLQAFLSSAPDGGDWLHVPGASKLIRK